VVSDTKLEILKTGMWMLFIVKSLSEEQDFGEEQLSASQEDALSSGNEQLAIVAIGSIHDRIPVPSVKRLRLTPLPFSSLSAISPYSITPLWISSKCKVRTEVEKTSGCLPFSLTQKRTSSNPI
jgi:hypothetical protein